MPESLSQKLQKQWRKAGDLRKSLLDTSVNSNRANNTYYNGYPSYSPIYIFNDYSSYNGGQRNNSRQDPPTWLVVLLAVTLITVAWPLIKWLLPSLAQLIAFTLAAGYFVASVPVITFFHGCEITGITSVVNSIGAAVKNSWNSFLDSLGWGESESAKLDTESYNLPSHSETATLDVATPVVRFSPLPTQEPVVEFYDDADNPPECGAAPKNKPT